MILKTLVLTFALAAASLPSFANEALVNVGNCAPIEFVSSFFVCDVQNQTNTPIAEISYSAGITQEGRTVPWIIADLNRPYREAVSGGIEPGETVPINFRVGNGAFRADPEKITVTIYVVSVFDVNGNEITLP